MEVLTDPNYVQTRLRERLSQKRSTGNSQDVLSDFVLKAEMLIAALNGHTWCTFSDRPIWKPFVVLHSVAHVKND